MNKSAANTIPRTRTHLDPEPALIEESQSVRMCGQAIMAVLRDVMELFACFFDRVDMDHD